MYPPPTFHPISSLWIIPVHQPQASCTFLLLFLTKSVDLIIRFLQHFIIVSAVLLQQKNDETNICMLEFLYIIHFGQYTMGVPKSMHILALLGNAKSPHKGVVTIYTYRSNMQDFLFLYILTNAVIGRHLNYCLI